MFIKIYIDILSLEILLHLICLILCFLWKTKKEPRMAPECYLYSINKILYTYTYLYSVFDALFNSYAMFRLPTDCTDYLHNLLYMLA